MSTTVLSVSSGTSRFQLPQVAGGELAQVLAQMDDADRVVDIGLEAAVDGDHFGARGQHVVGHRFQQGLGQFFIDRSVGHFQHDRGQAPLGGPDELSALIGDDQQLGVAGHLQQAVPIERVFQQQHQRIGLDGGRELDGEVEQRQEMVGKSLCRH